MLLSYAHPDIRGRVCRVNCVSVHVWIAGVRCSRQIYMLLSVPQPQPADQEPEWARAHRHRPAGEGRTTNLSPQRPLQQPAVRQLHPAGSGDGGWARLRRREKQAPAAGWQRRWAASAQHPRQCCGGANEGLARQQAWLGGWRHGGDAWRQEPEPAASSGHVAVPERAKVGDGAAREMRGIA